MPLSAIEIAHNDLIDAFKTITEKKGYRNTVKAVTKVVQEIESVTNFPTLVVFPMNETVKSMNDAQTTFKSDIIFTVLGYVNSDITTGDEGTLTTATESLIHDCKRLLAKITVENLIDKRFYISFLEKHGGVKIQRFFDMNQGKSFFTMDFTVSVHHQAGDFV